MPYSADMVAWVSWKFWAKGRSDSTRMGRIITWGFGSYPAVGSQAMFTANTSTSMIASQNSAIEITE